MKTITAGMSMFLLIGYLLYCAFTKIVILPFVTQGESSSTLYFAGLLLTATIIVGLSFMKHKRLAAFLAFGLATASLCYWWLIICHSYDPIWPDFGWFVVPEICFALAVTYRWWADHMKVPL